MLKLEFTFAQKMKYPINICEEKLKNRIGEDYFWLYDCANDAEKIAFVPYNEIQDVFYINDFSWNATPFNYETKEFKLL